MNEAKTTEALSGNKRTEYSVTIVNKTGLNRIVGITIKRLENPIQIVSGDDWVQELNSLSSNNPRLSSVRTDARIIDNASGGITSFTIKLDSGLILDAFKADYQPVFDSTHIVVEIDSTYPWDEGTLQLLKTIHVEMANI